MRDPFRRPLGRLPSAGLTLAAVVVFLVIWQLLSGTVLDPLLFSDPIDVLARMGQWAIDGTYLTNSWQTLSTAVIAFILGTLLGVVVGFVLGLSPTLGRIFEPLVTALYTIPRVALAPLFILWLGVGFEFKLVYAVMLVAFLVFFNTYIGVRQVPRDLLDTVALMGAGRMRLIFTVVLPSSLVWVAAGMKTSIPYALVGVVVAEVLVSNEGLGFLVRSSSAAFDAAGTFAAIAALAIIGLALDRVVSLLVRKPMMWKEERS